jgi:L-rhamnose-H+ transport protein
VEVFSSEQRNFTSKTKVISLALPKVGALHMGKLGTSLGWPLLMGTIILTSNVGGYIAGEWSGADRSIRSYLFSGMAIILLALGVLATAQRP